MVNTRSWLRQIQGELAHHINRFYKKKKRICACGCGKEFTPHRKAHFFYSPSCYAKYHRIPGMVNRILRGMD